MLEFLVAVALVRPLLASRDGETAAATGVTPGACAHLADMDHRDRACVHTARPVERPAWGDMLSWRCLGNISGRADWLPRGQGCSSRRRAYGFAILLRVNWRGDGTASCFAAGAKERIKDGQNEDVGERERRSRVGNRWI
jgi:hypothetical protein